MPFSPFFKHIADYPSDRETGWSEELQGVTHDDNNWFITQRDRLWKMHVTVDLNSAIDGPDANRGIFNVPIPPELKPYNHMGDPDHFEGHVFVPVEKIDSTRVASIACFNAETLGFIGSALVREQREHASWCAVNPADRFLYSSTFDNNSAINAYEFTIDAAGFKIKLHHKISLTDRGRSFTLNGIQGGVFSLLDGENFLYLSSNDDDTRGVHVFRWPDGKRVQTISIPRDFFGAGEEIEGLTFWDLDGGLAPGIRGQLHVLELDNDSVFPPDDVKGFKHYRFIQFPFVANSNPRCREVHRSDCRFIDLMKSEHKVGYRSFRKALDDRYDACHFCIGGKFDRR